MLQAISYIDFRGKFYLDADPVQPGFEWRKGRKHLAKWLEEAIMRPSVTWRFNVDFEGDTSPENLKRQVQEVLKAQKSQ
jgi:glutathione S-transferase